jgi:hypothetical protein
MVFGATTPKNLQSSDTYGLWQGAERPARFGIPSDIRSLPELLKQHGYFTWAASSGPIVRSTKDDAATNRGGGFGAGFDVFLEDCLNKSAECVNDEAVRLLPVAGRTWATLDVSMMPWVAAGHSRMRCFVEMDRSRERGGHTPDF